MSNVREKQIYHDLMETGLFLDQEHRGTINYRHEMSVCLNLKHTDFDLVIFNFDSVSERWYTGWFLWEKIGGENSNLKRRSPVSLERVLELASEEIQTKILFNLEILTKKDKV